MLSSFRRKSESRPCLFSTNQTLRDWTPAFAGVTKCLNGTLCSFNNLCSYFERFWGLPSVEGRPAVKLSDNYAKAVGSEQEIERYRRVFGTAGMNNLPVVT